MSNKKPSNSNIEDNKSTNTLEKTSEPQAGISASITLSDNNDDKVNHTNESSMSKAAKKVDPDHQPKKGSKPVQKNSSPEPVVSHKKSTFAIVAFCLAIIAIAGVVGLFVWNKQQHASNYEQLINGLQQQLQQSQMQTSQQFIDKLAQYQQQSDGRINTLRAELLTQTNATLAQLQEKVTRLQQHQPDDWLLQEAEYLIRVAARSLLLEKDTTAAIALLDDADLRIQALNNPEFLPLRQTIAQDIASLQLLPTLATDQVILTLMALDHQIAQLVLAMVKIPEATEAAQDLNLSNDIGDWRENLAKTWRRFQAEFITVSRRTGKVEPLISPEFQQNLRENLSLKLQTSIWAARQANSDIYLASLTDIQTWVNRYFDMNETINRRFNDEIETLKTAVIKVKLPKKLQALAMIRQHLSANKSLPVITAPSKAETSKDEILIKAQQKQKGDKKENKENKDNKEIKAEASNTEIDNIQRGEA